MHSEDRLTAPTIFQKDAGMKKVLMFPVVTILTLAMFGCSTKDNPVSRSTVPVESSPARPTQLAWQSSAELGVLYYPPGQIEKGHLSDTDLVTPGHGGNVKADFEYAASAGGKIHVHAELKVPEGAVDHNVLISMTLDTTIVGIHFQPEGLVFNTPASLNFHVNHLNRVEDGPPIGFFYVDDDGNFEPIKYEHLDVHQHPDHSD